MQPESLWQTLLQRSEQAVARGALHTIETRQQGIEQGGMRFVVRIAANLKRKAEEKRRQQSTRGEGGEFDPFLPPEPELTVGAIGEDHLAVLNKFNVVDRHLLIVTRHFEHQETLLTPSDFQALWTAMASYEALGFYNGGKVAGASQKHKHLQMIPLPLADGGLALPVDPLVAGISPSAGITTVAGLPFSHRFAALEPGLWQSTAEAAELTRTLYLEMLDGLGIPPEIKEGTLWQSAPYNLLVTRNWVMVVPRPREHYEGISINAMGFAGSLFVRDAEELALVERIGPMTILQSVT